MATSTKRVIPPDVPLPLGKDSLAWRINSEPTILFGGARALLLQVAHPSIAAGVEDHSSYRRDPWGRLFGTLHIVGKIMFGTPEESRRNIEMLEQFHRHITGTRDDGSTYRALDPDLILWVWATLIDTAVQVYERTVGPLSAAEREQYLHESKGLAYAVGVPVGGCPTDWAAFEAYYQHTMANELRVTEGARAVSVAVLAPPFPFGLAGVVAIPQRLVTAGLLPPSVRNDYGLSWSRRDQRLLDTFFHSVRLGSRLAVAPVRRAPAEFALRLDKPLRLPALQWLGGRIITTRLRRAGFAA